MKINTITSILAVFASMNIFYSIYAMTQGEIFNTIIFLINYLWLIYLASNLEEKRNAEYENKKKDKSESAF
jgi:hypothetical protein